MCLHVFQGFLSLPNFFPSVSSCVQAFSITVSLHVYFTHAHTHTHTLSLHSYYTGIFLNTGIPTILTVPSMLLILYPHTSMSVFFFSLFHRISLLIFDSSYL